MENEKKFPARQIMHADVSSYHILGFLVVAFPYAVTSMILVFFRSLFIHAEYFSSVKESENKFRIQIHIFQTLTECFFLISLQKICENHLFNLLLSKPADIKKTVN